MECLISNVLSLTRTTLSLSLLDYPATPSGPPTPRPPFGIGFSRPPRRAQCPAAVHLRRRRPPRRLCARRLPSGRGAAAGAAAAAARADARRGESVSADVEGWLLMRNKRQLIWFGLFTSVCSLCRSWAWWTRQRFPLRWIRITCRRDPACGNAAGGCGNCVGHGTLFPSSLTPACFPVDVTIW